MQDLVRTIAEEMKVSPEVAVAASITRESLRMAAKEGYGKVDAIPPASPGRGVPFLSKGINVAACSKTTYIRLKLPI